MSNIIISGAGLLRSHQRRGGIFKKEDVEFMTLNWNEGGAWGRPVGGQARPGTAGGQEGQKTEQRTD